MKRLRIIWDDGTPRCLPSWAKDEIVRRRLEETKLHADIRNLYVRLHKAGDEQAMGEMLAVSSGRLRESG